MNTQVPTGRGPLPTDPRPAYRDPVSTVHAAPPSSAWAQAAADAAEEVAHGGEVQLTLPDGTAAVLMP